jgi:hypothetical protein
MRPTCVELGGIEPPTVVRHGDGTSGLVLVDAMMGCPQHHSRAAVSRSVVSSS